MKKIRILLLIGLMLLNCSAAWAETAQAFTPITVDGVEYLNNLDICIAAINGTELETEEEFSFNALVGPRSEGNGYLLAINGRGVPVIGGGVAQVATTVYLAVNKLSTIEITEMRTYGSDFCAGYVADVADAVVVDYSQPIDFRFINHAPAIELEVWRDDSNVYCSAAAVPTTQATMSTVAPTAPTAHTAEPTATVEASCPTAAPATPAPTEVEVPETEPAQTESVLPDLSEESIG